MGTDRAVSAEAAPVASDAVVAPRRGRKRSEAADQAIVAATLDVLEELGYAKATMAQVIERAGVSSATLYRRCATKQELVEAALRSLPFQVPAIDTGSLEGDVEAYVVWASRSMSRRRFDLPGMLSTELREEPELHAFVQERFVVPILGVLDQILCRAQERGELGQLPPTDLCWSFLNGALQHVIITRREPFTRRHVRSTTTFMMAGLRALGTG